MSDARKMITIDPCDRINPSQLWDECSNGHWEKMEIQSIQLITSDNQVAKSFTNETPEVCIDLYCHECEDNYFRNGTLAIYPT